VDALTPGNSFSAVIGGNYTASYRGCIIWNKTKEALIRLAPEDARKNAATGNPDALKAQRAGPSAEQRDLVERWYHVLRGRFVKATTTPLKIIKPLLS
jgi:hypothetical protein